MLATARTRPKPRVRNSTQVFHRRTRGPRTWAIACPHPLAENWIRKVEELGLKSDTLRWYQCPCVSRGFSLLGYNTSHWPISDDSEQSRVKHLLAGLEQRGLFKFVPPLISTCVQNPTYTTHTHPQHTDTSPPPPQVLEQKAVPWLTGERNWARWGDWGFSPRTVGTRQRILIQQEVSSGLCSITYSLPYGEESMGHCGNRRPVETPDV